MMRARQSGVTLIELVIAMVVIGFCVVAALSWMSSASVSSARNMTRSQAITIADSYLRDVLVKTYNEVRAYPADTYHNGARDTYGVPIAGLERYNVRINRVQVNIGNAPNATVAQRVIVIVTDPTGGATRITGFRTNYVGQVVY
ncbi:MAG: prepilin-type N-terminal cleavage/methylation domain-containing protein [Steroidobacter sp.]